MNFSGQYRKSRNINLGGRNAGTTGSRESILRKAQADRQRREQARKEEKAAITIQSYYRGRSELWNQRILIAQEWQNRYINNRTMSSITNENDLIRCLQEFQFALRFLIHQKDFLEYLNCLYQIVLENKQYLGGIPANKVNVRMADYLFQKFPVDLIQAVLDIKSSSSSSAYELSLCTILIIYQCIEIAFPIKLISLLSQMVQNLLSKGYSSSRSDLGPLISKIIQPLWKTNPQLVITEILSIPDVLSLISPASFNTVNLLSIKSVFESQMSISEDISRSLDNLDSNRRLWILANSMSCIIDIEVNPKMDDIDLLVSLLYILDVKIIEKSEIDYSDSETSNSNLTPTTAKFRSQGKKVFLFSSNSIPIHVQKINKLYERDFTSRLFALLSKDHSPGSINEMATLYVYLIKLFPRRRKDLMLYLSLVTLTDGTSSSSPVHVFWESFKQSHCYTQTFSGILSQTVLLSICSEYASWMKLILTLELYSYWLIVADDTEFWENEKQGISFQEVRNMSIFLKNFTYSLIWNWPRVESESTISNETGEQFKKLKDISLLVIRQIYIRDSRRQFLGNDFWLMGNNIIDMEHFIPAVVEEEERQQEAAARATADDSDEDIEQFSSTRDVMKAVVAPRLEILKQVPFFMPFDLRVHVFQAFIELDRVRTQQATPSMMDFFGNVPRIKADIRREHLLDDAFREFSNAGSSFKFPIGVTFLSQGIPESGIDGGGLTKEFLTSVCKEGFYESRLDLFHATRDHLLYPNPVFGVQRKFSELSNEELEIPLSYIEFLGQIIGKCLYSEILVDVEFAPFFLLKWAGKASKNSFDDLYSLDPEIYNSLVKVHKYPGSVEEDLNLNFVTIQNVGHGIQRSIELRPDGEDIPVTNNNRLEYIHSIANYKLNSVLAAQTNRFLRGMSKVISLNWLSMFNAKELQMLISGGNSKIDLDDLEDHTIYGGYLKYDKTIEYFWQVVKEFSEEDKRNFIKFVTSVPKAPLLGFSQLNPKFAIRNAGSDKTRLPTSSTCVNLLKLPDYKDKGILKEKLLYAIRAGAGFDLS